MNESRSDARRRGLAVAAIIAVITIWLAASRLDAPERGAEPGARTAESTRGDDAPIETPHEDGPSAASKTDDAVPTHEVVVVDAETSLPIAGARFEVMQDRSRVDMDGWIAVRTGADGHATLRCPGTEVRTIRALADGYRSSEPTVPPRDGSPLRFELRAGSLIEGRVVDPDGSGVAEVILAAGDSFTVSEADGRFRLTVPSPGPVTISVGRASRVDVRAPASGVVLDAPPLWRVRFVGPTGEPVRSGRVGLRTGFDADAVRPIPASGEMRTRLPFVAGKTTATLPELAALDDGTRLGCGVYRVEEDAAGRLVRVERAAALTGRVLDPDGASVPGAQLALFPANAFTTLSHPVFDRAPHRTETDAEGRFAIPNLRAGPYRARVSGPDGTTPAYVDLVAGGEAVTIRLEASAAGTIVVRDASGRPVASATLVVMGGREMKPPFARTDPRGTARVPGLEAGRAYRVGVTPPDGAALLEKTVVWRPERPLEVVLDPGRLVAGVVVDLAEEPVPLAYVFVYGDGHRIGRLKADEEGRFRGVLRLGPLELAASMGGVTPFGWKERRHPIDADEDATSLRLVMERPATLEVEVPAEARGAAVRFFDELDPEAPAPVGRAPADGAPLVLRGVLRRDGVYTLWAPLPDDDRFGWITGVRGDAGRVTLELVAGESLAGTIRPARVYRMNLRRERFELRITTDADGRFRARGLPPGRWSLRVRSGGRWVERVATTGTPVEIELDE